MVNWTYKCYNNGKPINLWQQWYDDSSMTVRAKHDATFEILEPKTVWTMPKAKSLRNGLIEVRLTGDVAWRIFGFYGKQKRHEFIVVAVGNHKDRVYHPQKIIDTAKKRKEEINSNPAKAKSCERPE